MKYIIKNHFSNLFLFLSGLLADSKLHMSLLYFYLTVLLESKLKPNISFNELNGDCVCFARNMLCMQLF